MISTTVPETRKDQPTVKLHREWLGAKLVREAPVPVILNTVTGDSRTFRALFQPLAQRWPVLLVDSSGRGDSGLSSEPASISQQLGQLSEVVSSEGLAAPVWVGNSASTGLAYRAAATLPGVGLVLLSPLFDLGQRRRIALLRSNLLVALDRGSLDGFQQLLSLLSFGSRFLEANPFVLTAGKIRLAQLFTEESLRLALLQTFFPEPDDAELLGKVSCPVLALRGAEEMLQPLDLLEEHLAPLASVTVQTLDCGHALLEEGGEIVLACIADFLDRLATAF